MEPQARVYRCPECGGPNDEAQRHCEFCRSPIATLRCAHCFHLNVSDAEHCSGCGEILGLMPLELPSALDCPECNVNLTAFDGAPGHLYDCPQCAGQFIEHHLLYNLIERRRRFADPRPLTRADPSGREVRYMPCPACREIMNRRNFGGQSGIIVDYCARHGVWFQPGEFPKVLSFVAAGGLAEGRRLRLGLPKPRSAEQEKDIARKIAYAIDREPHPLAVQSSARSPAATVSGTAPSTVDSILEVATGVTESTLDLLEVLGNFLLDRD